MVKPTRRSAETDRRRVQIELVDAESAHAPTASLRQPTRFGRALSVTLSAVVVAVIWFAARPESGNDAAAEPIAPASTPVAQSPTSSADPEVEGPADDIDRILALRRDVGGLRALTATAGSDGSTVVGFRTSLDGQGWRPEVGFEEFLIPGFVRSGSLRGDRWVAVADYPSPTLVPAGESRGVVIYVGDQRSVELRIQIPPDESVESYAATASGFVATLVRVEPDSTDRARLTRWTANWGLQDIGGTLGDFDSTPEVIDGDRVAVVVDSRRFVAADPEALAWTPVR